MYIVPANYHGLVGRRKVEEQRARDGYNMRDVEEDDAVIDHKSVIGGVGGAAYGGMVVAERSKVVYLEEEEEEEEVQRGTEAVQNRDFRPQQQQQKR